MRSVAILLAGAILCSCGDDTADPGDSPDEEGKQSLTRVIKYQFDGDSIETVLVTDFSGVANKTVTNAGKEVTTPVELDEFNYLWNAQHDIPIIKESLLGEQFSGIHTETHHIIVFTTTGATRSAEMHAVSDADATNKFKEWLARLLKTKEE